MLGAIASCGVSNHTADAAAKSFLEALNTRDSTTALRIATPESATPVRFMLQTLALFPKEKGFKISIDKLTCTTTGEQARCVYCCDQNQREGSLKLVQRGGEWLVDAVKDTPNFVPPAAADTSNATQ